RAAVAETLERRQLLSAALVADLNLDTPSSNPSQFTQLGSAVLVGATTTAPQLWKSDGTDAGTLALGTFLGDSGVTTAPALSPPLALFFANQSGTGRELFRPDGTPGGTMLVKDINPGA